VKKSCEPRTVPSRREFLVYAASAVVGGVAMRPAKAEGRQMATLTEADLHYHVLPQVPLPSEGRRLAAEACLPVESWNPRRAIAAMDAAGVGVSVLSMPTSQVQVSAISYRDYVRSCNEWAAGVARKYPARFGFFASIPLPDLEGAVEEVRYACDVLNADGVLLATSYGVRRIGDPAFEPVLEALDARSALVSVHPPGTNCCRGLSRYLPYGDEAPGETQDALASLRGNATLAGLTHIRYLFSHRPNGYGPFSSTQL
jgi:predicted TIM-barrel fold metal-dependent hydrolase